MAVPHHGCTGHTHCPVPQSCSSRTISRRSVTRKHSWLVLGWRWGVVTQVWLGVLLPVRKVMNDREGRNYDHPQLSSQQRTRPCGGRAHIRKGKSLACGSARLCVTVWTPRTQRSPDAPDGWGMNEVVRVKCREGGGHKAHACCSFKFYFYRLKISIQMGSLHTRISQFIKLTGFP